MTDIISLPQLQRIMPHSGKQAAKHINELNSAMFEFAIIDAYRVAPFLAQLAHESGELQSMSESFNYTPSAILATFNRKAQRFTPAQAEQYGRTAQHPANQQMIANVAYANRMGNGDVASGDGWRHRGSGGIQLTGKTNQTRCANYFGIPVAQIGDWLRTPEGAMRSAAWFWSISGANEAADKKDFDAVSDVVNIGRHTLAQGDSIGYTDRLEFYKVALTTLA